MANPPPRQIKQGEPMLRGLDQLRVPRVAGDHQLLLGRQQIRRVDPRQPLSAADRIADRTHVELLDPTRLTHFDRLDPVLIHGDRTNGIDSADEAASLNTAEPDPKIRYAASIDRH